MISLRLSILFFCASTVWSAGGIASEGCTNVRLDQTSLKTVPIMDQDGSGICYAYVASLLIDAYRFSHGDDNSTLITSPIAAAAFGSDDPHNTNGYGYVPLVINQMRKKYSCDHRQVSKFISPINFMTSKSAERWPMDALMKTVTAAGVCAVCQEQNKLAYLVELRHSFKPTSLENFRQKIETICKGHTTSLSALPPPKVKAVQAIVNFYSEPVKVADAIAELLNKPNPQPIAISICEDVMRDRKVETLDRTGHRSGCFNHHLAAVVGSRKGTNGQCEYLIRNSYGTSCNAYDWPCEEGTGQVWLSGRAIGRNIEGFTWLE